MMRRRLLCTSLTRLPVSTLFSKIILDKSLDLCSLQTYNVKACQVDLKKPGKAYFFYVVYICQFTGVLNLRGADVPSNPFFFAFVIVTSSDIK